jgi:hypothetical protein
MEVATIVAAVLRAVNDNTTVRAYGDGVLVDLPLVYGDGDSVRILVEPMGSGFRVSDRAAATTLLTMAGVNIGAGRPAEAFEAAALTNQLNQISAAPGELATFGDADNLGRLVLDVAQASMRVEQLRWLAVRQASARFPDRVTDRVRAWAQGGRKIQREAKVKLRSGRSRPVTLSVSNDHQAAYIQAVGSRDREQAAEHCYAVFGLSEVPQNARIAALDGSKEDWPKAIVEELASVSSVEFFADPLGLERHLDRVVPPSQPVLPC